MRIFSVIVVLVVLVGAIFIPQFVFVVDETELAIVTRFGEIQKQVKEPGLYTKSPFIDNVIYFDKRLLIFDAPPESLLTRDKKRLIIDVYARGRIQDPALFYRTVATEERAATRAIDIISSELRREIALDDQLDVIKNTREQIMNRVRDSVIPVLSEVGLTIVDVRIKRADFPPQIATSVYERMKSERKRIADRERAEGAEFDLEKRASVDRSAVELISEAQKRAEIIRGEAEAEAISIFADALERDPEFYGFQRSLETYKKVLGSDTTIILDPNSQFLKYFGSPE